MTLSPAPLFRHGDVFLQAVAAPSVPLYRQPHTTLAHGEVTGHSHRIAEAGAAALFGLTPQPQEGAERFLQVTAPATLIHEEHAPIRLETGWYRVWQQREYTPGRVRVVLD